MRQGEETQVNNVRPQEKKIEKAVIECIGRIEKSIQGINPTEADMNWNVVDNFSNPTREEINNQLNRIPAIQAYYNNMKVYAQLLLDIAEHELIVAQVKARDDFREFHMQRIKNYEAEIAKYMADALRSTAQDKAMKLVTDMVKALKPKEPTDKDIEAFIKGRTQEQERQVIIHRNRYNKLREYCKVLENKFLAARALRYSIEENNKVDINVSKNSV